MQKIELLAPAGNFEKLKVAFHFGADACYVGLDKLSLRANADNFTREELKEALHYTHSLSKRMYIAINIYFTPDQTNEITDALHFINALQPDGLIISDMGMVELAQEICPSIPIHISTQANNTNQFSVRLLGKLGVKRTVLARELSIAHIKQIHNANPEMELEAFVHGAMCIAYSGRCLLSSYMTHQNLAARDNKSLDGRSANKGDCAHSCRWEFVMKEKSRDNDTFEITEDSQGTYILSSKDICMIAHLNDLIEAGVSSFKIEGRMKSVLYISSTVRAYRFVLDRILAGESPEVPVEVLNELEVVSHREFSTGFFYTTPQKDALVSNTIEYTRTKRLVALCLDATTPTPIKVYNKFSKDETLELISNNMKTIQIKKITIRNSFGEIIDNAKHEEITTVELFDSSGALITPQANDILRIDASF